MVTLVQKGVTDVSLGEGRSRRVLYPLRTGTGAIRVWGRQPLRRTDHNVNPSEEGVAVRIPFYYRERIDVSKKFVRGRRDKDEVVPYLWFEQP